MCTHALQYPFLLDFLFYFNHFLLDSWCALLHTYHDAVNLTVYEKRITPYVSCGELEF